MGWDVAQAASSHRCSGSCVVGEKEMSGDEQVFQAWLNELQIVVDTLREDKKDLQARVTELEKQIAMYKSMVERLQLAISQGSDNWI